MTDVLNFTVDKFTFTVPTDRFYHPAGIWVQEQAGRLVIGVTDYYQQHSGDVAFAEVAGAGTVVAAGERLADIETIKTDNEVTSPVTGSVVAANEKLTFEAEVINQSPYGDGWLAIIEPADWVAEKAALLTPEEYFEHNRTQALEETGQK